LIIRDINIIILGGVIMKEIIQINKTFDSGLNVNELKGKDVIDNNGKKVGSILGLRLNMESLGLDGIEMDRGFFGQDTFIGCDYIESLGVDGATLNMTPVKDYKGLVVVDAGGEEVGKVTEIRTEGQSNNITAIVVRTGIGKNDAVFSKSDIRSVGGNILLNVEYNSKAVKVGGKSK
jgi:sporulation protein YlmC with PRC-barrel domain